MIVVQLNINHCRAAQDMLMQHVMETGAGLACVAEPYMVPDSQLWFGDLDNTAAVYWHPRACKLEVRPIVRGRGFVGIKIGGWRMFSVYLSPNECRKDFEDRLDRLADSVRRTGPSPFVIMGDFNAASTSWGSKRTNMRGEVLEEWAASLDLVLLNVGTSPTCIRAQGTSVVDLTWCSPDMAKNMSNWRVIGDTETMSDHALIEIEIKQHVDAEITDCRRKKQATFPRWSTKSMNWDLLTAAMITKDWLCPQPVLCDSEEAAARLVQLLEEACDVAAPRVRTLPEKRQTYWWNKELAEGRKVCITLRRLMVKFRRQKNTIEAERSRVELRQAQRKLRAMIAAAKDKAWKELLASLQQDPWGRPYRLVLKRLKGAAVAVTESLEHRELKDIINGLFPQHDNAEGDWMDVPWAECRCELVTLDELKTVVKEIRNRNSAPGPDGVTMSVILTLLTVAPDRLLKCFNACLQRGRFPDC